MADNLKHWTIRVIQIDDRFPDMPTRTSNQLPPIWVEQMRHMGTARELAEFDDPPRTVIEFDAPYGISREGSKHWAETNAERMRSFGINAVAAPRWVRGTRITAMEAHNR